MIKDAILIAGGVLILMPLFYVMSNAPFNLYTLTAYMALLIPTLAALVNGAPFVPTPMGAVEKMLKVSKIKKGDKVYDIGCGDGRVVYLAANKHEANATGFELSPFVFIFAKIRQLLWRSKAKIQFANFKHKNLSDADIIFCYLLPETLLKLEPKLSKELKPGARIISYAFPIASWEEVKKHPRDAKQNIAPIWEYVKQ
ncbi:50S ribosomal protein L11 methyltransferase [Candidatus Peregrinibacteria bacterium]|nr:50S ribosomal protein L11 methyltransferase [Candidatus Peregrinibacteria bacterium]